MPVVRYDPVWRRIGLDSYTAKIEGKLPAEYRRLRDLLNWGCLAWLYPIAKQTKYDHHVGVQYQTIEMLRHNEEQRERHEASLRLAAQVVHLGHLPLSYAMEEAVIRASHVAARLERELETLTRSIATFGDLACDDAGHSCRQDVLDGSQPFELYKWLAAWRLRKSWKTAWEAVKAASVSELPSEDEVRQEAVRTLVCRENRGYKYLSLADKADHVQRDMLFTGTGSLNVPPGPLYARDPLGTAPPSEWDLLDAAQAHLRKSFYGSEDALLLHTLVVRLLAQDMIARRVRVVDLLRFGDEEAIKRVGRYYRTRLEDLRERAPQGWERVVRLPVVSVPLGSPLEIENRLYPRTGGGRLSYPFTSGLVVRVSRGSDALDAFAGDERQYVGVAISGVTANGARAWPVIDLLVRMSRSIAVRGRELLHGSLATWIAGSRCEIQSTALSEALGRIVIESCGAEQLGTIDFLRRSPRWRDMLGHRYFELEVDLVKRAVERGIVKQARGVGEFLLALPNAAWRTKRGRELGEAIRRAGLVAAGGTGSVDRGRGLEAAVWADVASQEEPELVERLVLAGVVMYDERRRPMHEWDVVRIDLRRGRIWDLWLYEASLDTAERKKDEAIERIDAMGKAVHEKFLDMRRFRGRLVSHDVMGGGLRYVTARRDYDQG